MVVDTSALLAILDNEADSLRFAHAMATAGSLAISAGTLVEAGLVASRAGGEKGIAALDRLLAQLDIAVVPVDLPQVSSAREGLLAFGKGRHPARLNLGDSFAYALARHLNEPLLFKGNDFAQTDVRRAL